MLFSWGPIWQSLSTFVIAWILYAVIGYEFAMVTLLAALVAKNLHN